MCTVTFIKHQDGFSLTSNRDEQATRPTFPPRVYEEYQQNLVYPKDQKAGGTWIASSEQNISVCLLNGAFKKHMRQLPYDRSRGQVLKERFAFQSNSEFIHKVDLNNVEPFTLLMIDHADQLDFKVLVWDGNQKHSKTVDTTQNHIWASATLYSDEQLKNRQIWFQKFLNNHDVINAKDILNFHTGSFTDDKSNDMLMQRDQELKTISVSQIDINSTQKQFIYKDLVENKDYVLNLNTLCQTV
ncbi:MAG: hypothetical protein GVY05_06805 [Bacteroidetes bacterium]|jgi:uncharacterized protein with NRDE domain|nr:hypothetical protein [Bacteroidota bacterium]